METGRALLRSLYAPEVWEKLREFATCLYHKPFLSIIAGSGWGDIVGGTTVQCFPYREIGIVFRQEVEGHAGMVRLLEAEQGVILVFEGRPHLYQGYRYEEVVLPVVLSALAGVKGLIITNAAGSLHRHIPPGNLCLLTDQVDFTFVPDPQVLQKRAYFSRELQILAHEAAKKERISLFSGTYVGVLGPSFETPAEIRMFVRFGDVIGMSTVKETKAAAALDLSVCGLSLVTNWGSGLTPSPLSHQEVLETAQRTKPLLGKFITTLVEEVARVWT